MVLTPSVLTLSLNGVAALLERPAKQLLGFHRRPAAGNARRVYDSLDRQLVRTVRVHDEVSLSTRPGGKEFPMSSGGRHLR